MSVISLFLITIIVVFVICYQGYKRFMLANVTRALKKQDYEMVVQLVDMSMSRKLLGEYTCDLYKIRSYYLAKNVNEFEKQLHHMIETSYKKDDDKRAFLEQYFHTFLIKGNRAYSEILLAAIKSTNDEHFITYNEQAFEVMLNKRTDLQEEMENQINSKKYYGFPLGVIVFMIAKQNEYLQKNEEAIINYQTALTCFHPKSIYVPLINEQMKYLKALGN